VCRATCLGLSVLMSLPVALLSAVLAMQGPPFNWIRLSQHYAMLCDMNPVPMGSAKVCTVFGLPIQFSTWSGTDATGLLLMPSSEDVCIFSAVTAANLMCVR